MKSAKISMETISLLVLVDSTFGPFLRNVVVLNVFSSSIASNFGIGVIEVNRMIIGFLTTYHNKGFLWRSPNMCDICTFCLLLHLVTI